MSVHYRNRASLGCWLERDRRSLTGRMLWPGVLEQHGTRMGSQFRPVAHIRVEECKYFLMLVVYRLEAIADCC